MKRKIFLLGALALCLTGCGQKKQVKTPTSSEQKAIKAKAEKLETVNVTATDEELKKGIQQVGVEEAQKQLRESFTKDDAFKEALTVPGFTADLTLENENEYKVTITYDFEAMDVKKAEGMTYFKNNHLPELLKLTPSQFADNLINAGASEQK